MTDEEWQAIRIQQEHEDLESALEHALENVAEHEHDDIRDAFAASLAAGGARSVYALVEKLDHIRFVMVYPLVAEHFLRARRPDSEPSKAEREQSVRAKAQLAEQLRKAGDAAREVPTASAVFGELAENLTELSSKLDQLAEDERELDADRHAGRPREPETEFAVALDALFWESKLPSTRRAELAAGVISAFVEPILGEKVRQRLKDLRRRPRTS